MCASSKDYSVAWPLSQLGQSIGGSFGLKSILDMAQTWLLSWDLVSDVVTVSWDLVSDVVTELIVRNWVSDSRGFARGTSREGVILLPPL